MQVIGGDFGSPPANVFSDRLAIHARGGDRNYKAGFIRAVNVVTNENRTSVLGAFGGGLAGAVVAGPLGAVVGGVLGGRSNEHVAVVVVEDATGDKRLVCKISEDELSTLLCLANTPKRRVKKLNWGFLEEPEPQQQALAYQHLQCPLCSGQFVNDPALAGMVVLCPTCGGQLQMPN